MSAFLAGMGIGTLGGLIGLGGAEFRLPLLIGLFRFGPLEAVIVNKAMSLIVVASALPLRTGTISFSAIADHWLVIANLLAGSLLGAWVGAAWATRLRSETLYRVIAVLLVAIAGVLLVGHGAEGSGRPLLTGTAQIVAGVAAGFVIGVVASLLGVAGGELDPYPDPAVRRRREARRQPVAGGQPADHAGGLRSLQPRQHLRRAGRNRWFVIVMAAGSIAGSLVGALLLGIVPGFVLLPALAAILLISAYKVWRHK